MRFKRYYCINHDDKAKTGLACLATVAKQHGLHVSIQKLRQISCSDQNGASVSGLIKAAQQLKFSAKSIKLNQDDPLSKIPLPAIAQIIISSNEFRYVVIQKLDRKGILIADPLAGLSYYQPQHFCAIWSGTVIILAPTNQFERGHKEVGWVSRFSYLITGQKKFLLGIFIASLMLTLFGIVSAFYFKYLVDDILTNGLKDTLIIVTIGLIIVKVFSQLMTFFRSQLLLYFSLRIDLDLVLQYFQHVLELPAGFFGSRRVGEIISRANDEQKIRKALSNATVSVLFDSVMLIFGGIIVFAQNSKLTFMTLIFLPIYLILVIVFRRAFQNTNRRLMEQSAELQSQLVESFSGIEVIKANNAEGRFRWLMESIYVQLIRWAYKLGWMSNLQSFLKGLVTEGITILVWLSGGLQVIRGELTLGQLMAFNSLLFYFMTPIENLINLQSTFQEAYVAADRLVEILDLDVEKQNEDHKIHLKKINGEIEFRNVSFHYGDGNLVLKNVNLQIHAGEKIALVGETGCGKTTLVKLLLGFYTPQNGQIIIDGHNIKDICLEDLRDRIGYVPQENYLFKGTIRENIAFCSPDAPLEEIIEVAKQVHLHDFIEELPLRYETVISERGSSLSGGQRQRISIARAISKRPDLLILDEATSNLDTITENAVHNTIDNITKNITTIIIAHRLSTIVKCDRIIVMDKGEIVESGSHKELLRNKGPYYYSWQAQIGAQRGIAVTGA